jgi:hypothetical protein
LSMDYKLYFANIVKIVRYSDISTNKQFYTQECKKEKR